MEYIIDDQRLTASAMISGTYAGRFSCRMHPSEDGQKANTYDSPSIPELSFFLSSYSKVLSLTPYFPVHISAKTLHTKTTVSHTTRIIRT